MKQFFKRSLLSIIYAVVVVFLAWATDTDNTKKQSIIDCKQWDSSKSRISEMGTSVTSSENTETRTREKEETSVSIDEQSNVITGIVTKKEYKDSFLMVMPTTLMPHRFPEKYLVTITYNNLSETFDDKELYYQVEEGDTVDVMLLYGKKLELLNY